MTTVFPVHGSLVEALGGHPDGDAGEGSLPAMAFGRLGLQLGPGLAQPVQPPGLAGQRCGQLVPAGVAEEPVLALVGVGGLPQDLGDFGLELVVGARLALSEALPAAWSRPERRYPPGASRRWRTA
jgi:hypothetical protein